MRTKLLGKELGPIAEKWCLAHGDTKPHPTIPPPPHSNQAPQCDRLRSTQGDVRVGAVGEPLAIHRHERH